MCIENPVKVEKEIITTYKVFRKYFRARTNSILQCPFYHEKMDCDYGEGIEFNKKYKAVDIEGWKDYCGYFENLGFSSFPNIEFAYQYIYDIGYKDYFAIVQCIISGNIYKGYIPDGFYGRDLPVYNSEYIEFIEETY